MKVGLILDGGGGREWAGRLLISNPFVFWSFSCSHPPVIQLWREGRVRWLHMGAAIVMLENTF